MNFNTSFPPYDSDDEPTAHSCCKCSCTNTEETVCDIAAAIVYNGNEYTYTSKFDAIANAIEIAEYNYGDIPSGTVNLTANVTGSQQSNTYFWVHDPPEKPIEDTTFKLDFGLIADPQSGATYDVAYDLTDKDCGTWLYSVNLTVRDPNDTNCFSSVYFAWKIKLCIVQADFVATRLQDDQSFTSYNTYQDGLDNKQEIDIDNKGPGDFQLFSLVHATPYKDNAKGWFINIFAVKSGNQILDHPYPLNSIETDNSYVPIFNFDNISEDLSDGVRFDISLRATCAHDLQCIDLEYFTFESTTCDITAVMTVTTPVTENLPSQTLFGYETQAEADQNQLQVTIKSEQPKTFTFQDISPPGDQDDRKWFFKQGNNAEIELTPLVISNSDGIDLSADEKTLTVQIEFNDENDETEQFQFCVHLRIYEEDNPNNCKDDQYWCVLIDELCVVQARHCKTSFGAKRTYDSPTPTWPVPDRISTKPTRQCVVSWDDCSLCWDDTNPNPIEFRITRMSVGCSITQDPGTPGTWLDPIVSATGTPTPWKAIPANGKIGARLDLEQFTTLYIFEIEQRTAGDNATTDTAFSTWQISVPPEIPRSEEIVPVSTDETTPRGNIKSAFSTWLYTPIPAGFGTSPPVPANAKLSQAYLDVPQIDDQDITIDLRNTNFNKRASTTTVQIPIWWTAAEDPNTPKDLSISIKNYARNDNRFYTGTFGTTPFNIQCVNGADNPPVLHTISTQVTRTDLSPAGRKQYVIFDYYDRSWPNGKEDLPDQRNALPIELFSTWIPRSVTDATNGSGRRRITSRQAWNRAWDPISFNENYPNPTLVYDDNVQVFQPGQNKDVLGTGNGFFTEGINAKPNIFTILEHWIPIPAWKNQVDDYIAESGWTLPLSLSQEAELVEFLPDLQVEFSGGMWIYAARSAALWNNLNYEEFLFCPYDDEPPKIGWATIPKNVIRLNIFNGSPVLLFWSSRAFNEFGSLRIQNFYLLG